MSDRHCTNGHDVAVGSVICAECGAEVVYSPGVPSSGKTNAAMMANIALGFSFLWVCSGGSLVAVIVGHKALREIEHQPQPGRGRALAAVIIGWTGIAVLVLLVLLGQ